MRIFKLLETKPYAVVGKNEISEIVAMQGLTNFQKLFLLAIILLSGKDKKTVLSAKRWSELLNVSSDWILKTQKILENKDLVWVTRQECENGFKQINEIELKSRKSNYDLFFRIDALLARKIISHEKLNHFDKLLWFVCYKDLYSTFMSSNNKDVYVTRTAELAEKLCSSRAAVLESIKRLKKLGFLKSNNYRVAYNQENIKRKSIWEISVSVPENIIMILEAQKNRAKIAFADKSNFRDSSVVVAPVLCENNNSSVLYNKNIIKSCNKNLSLEERSSGHEKAMISFDKKILEERFLKRYKIGLEAFDGDKNLAKKQAEAAFTEQELKFLYSDVKKDSEPKRTSTRPQEHTNDSDLKLQKVDVCEELVKNSKITLSPDSLILIKRYASKLLSKKIAKGYASTLSEKRLEQELAVHVACWRPTKIGEVTQTERTKIALGIAWDKIKKGVWKCPYVLLEADILNREHKSHLEKIESGYVSKEWNTHKAKFQTYLNKSIERLRSVV